MTDTAAAAGPLVRQAAASGTGTGVRESGRGRARRDPDAAADLDARARPREHVRPARRPRPRRGRPRSARAELWKALKQRLKTAGFKLNDVHTVVVTHSHPDHFGGAGRIRKESRRRAHRAPGVHDVVARPEWPAERISARPRRSELEAGRDRRGRAAQAVDVAAEEIPTSTIDDDDYETGDPLRDDPTPEPSASPCRGAARRRGAAASTRCRRCKRRMRSGRCACCSRRRTRPGACEHGEPIQLARPRVARVHTPGPHARPPLPLRPGVRHPALGRPRAAVDHAARRRASGNGADALKSYLADPRPRRRARRREARPARARPPVRRRARPRRRDQGAPRRAHGAAARRVDRASARRPCRSSRTRSSRASTGA